MMVELRSRNARARRHTFWQSAGSDHAAGCANSSEPTQEHKACGTMATGRWQAPGAHIPVEVGRGDAGPVDAVLSAQRHEVQPHALALLGLQVRQIAVQHACARTPYELGTGDFPGGSAMYAYLAALRSQTRLSAGHGVPQLGD